MERVPLLTRRSSALSRRQRARGPEKQIGHGPQLVVMDEPFRGDAMTRQLMQEYYLRLFGRGRTRRWPRPATSH
jgi:ABC-type nitrate/sulfonate/bicarbonate transport system ATPase subunit